MFSGILELGFNRGFQQTKQIMIRCSMDLGPPINQILAIKKSDPENDPP